jgi:hypothetical protein
MPCRSKFAVKRPQNKKRLRPQSDEKALLAVPPKFFEPKLKTLIAITGFPETS